MTKTTRTLAKRTSAIALTIVMTLGSAAVVYANSSSRLDEARQRSYEQRQQARERAEANRQAAWDRLIEQTPEQHRQAVIEARERSGVGTSQVQPSQPSQPQQGQVRPVVPSAQNQIQGDRPMTVTILGVEHEVGADGIVLIDDGLGEPFEFVVPRYVWLDGERIPIDDERIGSIVPIRPANSVTQPPQVSQNPAQQNQQETASAMPLPNRRLTEAERRQWVNNYNELGGATSFELEAVRLINNVRAEHSLSQVEIDEVLMQAARFYAQTKSQFRPRVGHNVGPYATNPDARHGASANVAAAFGARLIWNGGNSAGGGRSAGELIVAWMSSAGHRNYILSPEHRFIGIGQFGDAGPTYLFLSSNYSLGLGND